MKKTFSGDLRLFKGVNIFNESTISISWLYYCTAVVEDITIGENWIRGAWHFFVLFSQFM